MDLAALNMQRGRDHGLPDYNTARASYGLLAKTGFLTDGLLEDGATPNGITADPELAATLQEVYGAIDNVDLWMGALSEEHLVDSGIGELLTAGIIDQFTRLRDGDRFFYQIDLELSTAAIEAVINLDDVTLRDILEWNTNAQFASDNLFVVPEPASGALALLTSLGVLLLLRKKSGGIA
jgi:hypothetical protein